MERQVGTVLHNIMRQKTDIYLRKIILSVVYFTMISATENIAFNSRMAKFKGFEEEKDCCLANGIHEFAGTK
jgi:hypothetical protein